MQAQLPYEKDWHSVFLASRSADSTSARLSPCSVIAQTRERNCLRIYLKLHFGTCSSMCSSQSLVPQFLQRFRNASSLHPSYSQCRTIGLMSLEEQVGF